MIVALLAVHLLAQTPSPSPEPRPNFAVIIVDDAGYADFANASPYETPNLDRLAATGVRFTAAYARPTCTPSRVSALLGRYAERVGLSGPLEPPATKGIPAEEITLAEALRDRGYQTFMVGKWHVGHAKAEYRPLGQGFARAAWVPISGQASPIEWWEDETRVESHAREQPGWKILNTGLTVRQRTAALKMLSERDAQRPFLLWLAFSRIHGPNAASVVKPKEDVRAAAMREVDEAIGQLVAQLPANTLVVVFSDNGAMSGKSNVPLTGVKASLGEGGIRVPMLAWGQGVSGGRVVTEAAAVWDWWPTLVLMAGGALPTDRDIDGRDLRGVLEGTGSREAYPLWWHGALVDWPWKIRKVKASWVVHNVSTDPSERSPVDDPAVLKRLVERYAQLPSPKTPRPSKTPRPARGGP